MGTNVSFSITISNTTIELLETKILERKSQMTFFLSTGFFNNLQKNHKTFHTLENILTIINHCSQ